MKVSDEGLIKAFVQNGDQDAFEELLSRHHARLKQIISRIIVDPNMRADVLQNTRLAVFKGLPKFRGTCKFSSWVYRVATNECFMHLRKYRHLLNERSLDILTAQNEDIAEYRSDKEIVRQYFQIKDDADRRLFTEYAIKTIDRTIQRLPPDYRDAAMCRLYSEMSNEESSAALGLSLPALKSRYNRACELLRLRLWRLNKLSMAA